MAIVTNKTHYELTLDYFANEKFDTPKEAYKRLDEIKEKAKADKGWFNASQNSEVLKVVTKVEKVSREDAA